MIKIDLNGIWDFVADLDPKYHIKHGAFQAPEACRRHWRKVQVPGVWQKYAERYDIFEGVCWYAKEFEIAELKAGSVAILRFGGVNYLCSVYVNGELVGSHEGGYTAFSFDCGKVIKPGKNHIAVKVDNRALITKWPPCLGYFNYGGIHRDVALEISETARLDDLWLQAQPESGGGRLVVSGQVEGDAAGTVLRISAGSGQSWESGIAADGKIECNIEFPGVKLWTPEEPHLEAVIVELLGPGREIIESREFDCGFRSISTQNRQVILNGEPFAFKGVCYVYDSQNIGLVMTDEQVETDVRLMKEMGCNAVRCHYPMDEKFYAVCDRLGLLVWIEPPVYCYHPQDDEIGTRYVDKEWKDLAVKMIEEMIQTAKNHPCVAIYGIGNECNTRNPEAEGFFRSLAATIRANDPNRLISYAALYGIVNGVIDVVDILGINSYWGWYDKISGGKGLSPDAEDRLEQKRGVREPIDLTKMRDMLNMVLDGKKNLALLLTEFGADSIPGFRSASRDLWSEDYHAELLTEVFEMAKEYPQIAGTFPFCFSDYRDPSKLPNGYWNELNLKGVVDYQRHKKMAFNALKKIYNNK